MKKHASRLASLRAAAMAFAVCGAPMAHANYACSGPVGYLGVGSDGQLTLSIANSTPIHVICSMGAQGPYGITPAGCKAAYATILAAKLASKSVVIYYNNEPLTCSTLPAWGAVPGAYFVQGPD